jgi:MFS family permease
LVDLTRKGEILTPAKSPPQARPGPEGTVFITRGITWRQTFVAFKYRNYRLWYLGQLVSLMGSWMQMTAQGYLVFQLTKSPAFLGYVGFAAGAPTWLFMLYGGVIADRLPRRTLLICTQAAMMCLAFVLAALTFTGLVRPWHIILLASFMGVAMAFDVPARQAFVLELVARKDMANAIALNSTMFNSATAVGPAVAGLIYALFGPAWCFLVNAISFVAIIVALLLMRIDLEPKEARKVSTLAELREGLKYAFHEPMIRTVIIVVGATSLFGFSFATLIPAWAVKILHGDATTNGYLQSARGVGALLSALLIATLSHYEIKGKLLTVGTLVFPALLLGFSFARWFPLSLLLMLGVGAALIQIMNLANALVQSLVPDRLRGRVMGLYGLTFFGLMPLGALWIGTVAEHLGEPVAVVVGALFSLAVALLVFVRVPGLRHLP